MKIVVPSSGQEINSAVDSRFGRTDFFLFLNKKGELVETVKNPGKSARRGAGVAASQKICSRGADVLIVSRIGPSASAVLKEEGMKIYSVKPGITVQEAFNLWEKGEAKRLEIPVTRGGGRRRGR